MQNPREGQERDSEAVGQLEEVRRALRTAGTGFRDAQRFAGVLVAGPFGGEDHAGGEAVEAEVEEGEDRLGQVGDDG